MEDRSRKKIVKSLILFLGVIFFGIAGFMIIEGWNVIDAVYMTIITLSTVGYGEIRALSNEGRIFTIFLIIFGLGSAATVLNSFATIFLENKLNHYLGRRAMKSELKKMNDHVILCGLGQIGTIIALKLQEKNIPFVIIAEEEEEIKKARQMRFLSIEGEITSDATLHNAGIKRAKSLVICLSDLTMNLSLSLAAKELNPKINVIAQGAETHLESRIMRAGADEVVYPLQLGGEQISEIIAGEYGHQGFVPHGAAQPVDGYAIQLYRHFSSQPATIKEILTKEKGLRAVGYKKQNGQVLDNPPEEKEVYQGDGVIMLLNSELMEQDENEADRIPGSIEWIEDYSVGISSIDGEHMRLVQIINHLNEAIRKEESKAVLVHTFDRLIEYAMEHFENEENLMRQHQYPEIEEHIKEHKKLMKTVMELNKEKKYIFPANVSEFLNSWLIDHILTTDMKYREYLRK